MFDDYFEGPEAYENDLFAWEDEQVFQDDVLEREDRYEDYDFIDEIEDVEWEDDYDGV